MRIKNPKTIAIISSLIGVVFLFTFFGNGCGKGFTPSASSPADANNSLLGDMDGNTLTDIIPNTKTVSVVYAKQTLDQLINCAGVEKVSDATVSMYESKKGSISVYGRAESITSPMMMAVISISGEVCKDLIAQEKLATTKRIFVGWDLNANALPSDTLMAESISKIALSCWDRQENSSEKTSIQDAVMSIGSNEQKASEKAALMLCTTMLSSLNSLLN